MSRFGYEMTRRLAAAPDGQVQKQTLMSDAILSAYKCFGN